MNPKPLTSDFLKGQATGRPVVGDGYTAGPQLCAYLQSGATVGGYRLTTLKSFENSIVGENYFVYRVDPTPQAGHPLR